MVASRQTGVAELLEHLRAPLSTIEHGAFLLSDHDLDPQLDGIVRRLELAARHARLLARQAIDLSRPRPVAPPIPRVELMTLCERAIARAQRHGPAPIELSGDRPALGRWSPQALEELVYHLLREALERGARQLAIAVRRNGPGFSVKVSSDGPPFPEALRAVLVGSASADDAGRAIERVRRTVEQHGGGLSARREPGERNLFEVVLPAG